LVECRRWCGEIGGVKEIVWRDWCSAGDGVEGMMEFGRGCGEIGGVKEIVGRDWWSAGDGVERLVG
jgi:hypothetical protein